MANMANKTEVEYTGSDSDGGREWLYGQCGNAVEDPCSNMFCCHPDLDIRRMQRGLNGTGEGDDRLDGYFSVINADYRTPADRLICKGCGSEDTLEDDRLTMFRCTECGYSTRPWNFSYKSVDAEVMDLSDKQIEVARAEETIREELEAARRRVAELEGSQASAMNVLRQLKKRKIDLL